MTGYEWLSLIISILSLFASCFTSFAVFYIGKKIENKKYKSYVEISARQFIIKYDENEIAYLPYCLMARCTHRLHKHLRVLYNDFNSLSDDIQKEVLRIKGYKNDLINDENWIYKCLDEIEKFARDNDLGETFLYDGYKYFYKVSRKHSSCKIDSYFEREEKYENSLGFYLKSVIFNGENKLYFRSYLESYYQVFVLNNNKNYLDRKNYPRPFDYLTKVENLENCNEDTICYWVMEIVSELADLVIRTNHGGYVNNLSKEKIILDCDTPPETFEDKFYSVLLKLYEVYLDEKK